MAPTAISSAAAATSPTSSSAVCPYCGGSGFYKKAVPFGHPDFAKLFPCVCKVAEQEQREAARLLEISNLAAFLDKTFETFNPNIPGVRRAYLRALEYARQRAAGSFCSATMGAVKPTWRRLSPIS